MTFAPQDQAVQEYIALHENAQESPSRTLPMVQRYYDLVTGFYEWGWGQSFHFAPRRKGESLRASLLRHEKRIGQMLASAPGSPREPHWLDLGCGVGGPMRTMAREFGARVTGINVNLGQVERGRRHNRTQNLDHLCDLIECDFAHLPPGENVYDGIYSFQAICHATDQRAVFAEAFRVLKPGAPFVTDEWCMTSLFDDSNAQHRAIRKGIELGSGVTTVPTYSEVLRAVQEAGFELVSHEDLAPAGASEHPWYLPLSAKFSVNGVYRTPLGRKLLHATLEVGEALRIAPPGTADVCQVLCGNADALVAGGKAGIFTPMYLIHARKPA